MLPKPQRVRRTEEFDAVFQNGQVVHGRLLSLRYLNAADGSRAGFIVGAKAAGNAVSRNRLKRRLREIIQPQLAKLTTPSDLVLIAKPAAASAKDDALSEEVSRLLKEATLIR